MVVNFHVNFYFSLILAEGHNNCSFQFLALEDDPSPSQVLAQQSGNQNLGEIKFSLPDYRRNSTQSPTAELLIGTSSDPKCHGQIIFIVWQRNWPGIWSRQCLFVFLLSVCPLVQNVTLAGMSAMSCPSTYSLGVWPPVIDIFITPPDFLFWGGGHPES